MWRARNVHNSPDVFYPMSISSYVVTPHSVDRNRLVGWCKKTKSTSTKIKISGTKSTSVGIISNVARKEYSTALFVLSLKLNQHDKDTSLARPKTEIDFGWRMTLRQVRPNALSDTDAYGTRLYNAWRIIEHKLLCVDNDSDSPPLLLIILVD